MKFEIEKNINTIKLHNKSPDYLNELVHLACHNPEWHAWFVEESAQLKQVFSHNRLVAIEHYGSTSISGICAKPIIDILIGVHDFSLTEQEKELLQCLGYEYIGRALLYERYFLKKRGVRNFHLAIARYEGSVWHDCILLRNYLYMHQLKALEYEQIKQQALRDGYVTVPEYAAYKSDFVVRLVQEARAWEAEKA